MVGDIYVRSNPLQSLIQGLRMKQAKDELGASRQELKDLRTKRQETETRDMSAFVDLLRDKPAVASTTTPTQMPSFDDADAQSMQGIQGYGATTGAQAARPGDPMAAYSMAAASQSPTLRKVGLEGTMSLASEQAKQRTAQAQQNKYMGILSKAQTPQDAIAAGVPIDTVKGYYESKNFGRTEAGRPIEVEGVNGEKMIQQVDKFGQPMGAPMPGYMPAQAVNTGDKTIFAKPLSGQSFGVNMSPGDKARLAQSANQFQQSQANRPERQAQIIDTDQGKMQVLPGGKLAPLMDTQGNMISGPKGPTGTLARQQEAGQALQAINQAEKLLPKATSSGLGSAVDSAAAFFGKSTSGAQAASQLKALEGELVSKMPKMSGPQSDKDVALYKQMAGVIGDQTQPVATRQAALNTVKEIQQRYATPAMNLGRQPYANSVMNQQSSGGVVDFGSLK
jgi:hypothetical protein